MNDFQARLFRTLAMAALSAISVPAMALKSDADQPLNIKADGWEGALKGGVQKLSGGVVITQGSLVARADNAELHSTAADSGDIRKVVLTGAPARLEQMLDGTGGQVLATAPKIEYSTETEIAVLRGGAVVDRGGDRLQAQTIEYGVSSGELRAVGQVGKQVEMTIQPRKKKPDAAQ